MAFWWGRVRNCALLRISKLNTAKSTVHRIISTAPFGAVELPTVITGKDGKQRQATQPERKAPQPELPSIPQRPISINVAKPGQISRETKKAQEVIEKASPEVFYRLAANDITVS